jgi:hypothetical protein
MLRKHTMEAAKLREMLPKSVNAQPKRRTSYII